MWSLAQTSYEVTFRTRVSCSHEERPSPMTTGFKLSGDRARFHELTKTRGKNTEIGTARTGTQALLRLATYGHDCKIVLVSSRHQCIGISLFVPLAADWHVPGQHLDAADSTQATSLKLILIGEESLRTGFNDLIALKTILR